MPMDLYERLDFHVFLGQDTSEAKSASSKEVWNQTGAPLK